MTTTLAETTTSPTASQLMATRLSAAFRARTPLIYLIGPEETRYKKYVFEAAASAKYLARMWDVKAGFTSINGAPDLSLDGASDPDVALDLIRYSDVDRKTVRTGERNVWVMCDLPVWFTPPTGSPLTLRSLRNLVQWLPSQPRESAQSIVIITPNAEVPPELANLATVIEWPLPDRDEVAALLDATITSLPDDMQKTAVNGKRDAVIDAAVGLSGEEVQACFSQSLVLSRTIDPLVVAEEKKRAIKGQGLLEFFDPPSGGMKAVGGLDIWKSWAVSRASAYSSAARAYGLPLPRGAVLMGISGCGKSYSVAALAGEWGVPMVKLDLGAMKSKYVGDSEARLRQGFRQIEAMGRVIVRIDEIEKALAGATGEAGDGGVAADAMGFLLSWMQDRPADSEVFIVATCNDATKLPPELLRKGRFDEVWWIDLPNHSEREAIMAATLKQHKRDAATLGIDLTAVADATDTFTGAEIAALVPDAMYVAFADGAREITTEDLVAAAKDVVPLAKTKEKEIKELRQLWAGRARAATSVAAAPTTTVTVGDGRALDL